MSATLITPDQRRRLQQRYEEGLQAAGGAAPDFAAAHAALADCLRADPGNILYLRAMLANLRRWRPRPKLSWLRGVFADRQFAGATQSRDWQHALRLAPEALQADPWDTQTLVALAEACQSQRLEEATLAWLQAALDVAPADGTILRRLATELMRQGSFAEAAETWQRLLKTDDDSRARRYVAILAPTAPLDQRVARPLRELAAAQPTSAAAHLDLAAFLARSGRFVDAEEVLSQAQAACGGDLSIRQAREQLQLDKSAQRIEIARRLAEFDPDERQRELVPRLETEHNRLAIDILHLQAERLPHEPALRLELGRRLKRAGNYSGAIQRLDEAAREPSVRAAALVELGECWQHLRQFKKALDLYTQAAEAAGGPEAAEPPSDELKLALYRQGTLAAAMNEPVRARTALARLVGFDHLYKDAQQRLDNLP